MVPRDGKSDIKSETLLNLRLLIVLRVSFLSGLNVLKILRICMEQSCCLPSCSLSSRRQKTVTSFTIKVGTTDNCKQLVEIKAKMKVTFHAVER